MYRVAIVDDEIWVCRLIQKLIDWEELGLELAFIENNGEDALERIIEERPDIVLSDIRMPDMDGMKMIERMRQKKINSRVIIISGYPDFDYAKKVMRHGAYDYLLKPVEKEELKNVLIKIVGELNEEAEQKEIIYHQNRNTEKIKDITSELFIKKLVARRHIEESLLKLAVSNKRLLDKVENVYTILVVKSIIDSNRDKDSLNFIENYSELYSELNDKCKKITFSIYNYRVFILNCGEDTADKLDDYIKAEYAELKYNQGRNVCIGYSNTFSDINEMETAFENAVHSSCQYLKDINESHIYSYSPDIDVKHELITREHAKMLMINVEALSVENMLEVINKIYAIINSEALEKPYIIQDTSIKISNLIINTLKGIDGLSGDEFKQQKMFFKKISACNSVKDFEPVVKEYYSDLVKKLYEKRRETSINIIEQAKQYIANNYNRKITLGDVAEHLYLNPKYFSNIFKKEVGVGFVEYVNSARIDVSIELLKENKYSIGQIASKVGFSDPKHFSKLFKKKTGVTPKEYRHYHI